MTPFVEIRRATQEDVGLLTAMRLEMRREREAAPLAVPEALFEASVRAFFTRTLADGSFVSFLAFCEGDAAACSGLSIQELPPSYSEPRGRRGYVTNMYTRPRWRGRGLASALLAEIIRACCELGCDAVALNASPAGRAIYLKAGFEEHPGEMTLKLRKRT